MYIVHRMSFRRKSFICSFLHNNNFDMYIYLCQYSDNLSVINVNIKIKLILEKVQNYLIHKNYTVEFFFVFKYLHKLSNYESLTSSLSLYSTEGQNRKSKIGNVEQKNIEVNEQVSKNAYLGHYYIKKIIYILHNIFYVEFNVKKIKSVRKIFGPFLKGQKICLQIL